MSYVLLMMMLSFANVYETVEYAASIHKWVCPDGVTSNWNAEGNCKDTGMDFEMVKFVTEPTESMDWVFPSSFNLSVGYSHHLEWDSCWGSKYYYGTKIPCSGLIVVGTLDAGDPLSWDYSKQNDLTTMEPNDLDAYISILSEIRTELHKRGICTDGCPGLMDRIKKEQSG